jgi:hypothetical protein
VKPVAKVGRVFQESKVTPVSKDPLERLGYRVRQVKLGPMEYRVSLDLRVQSVRKGNVALMEPMGTQVLTVL